jgi:tol-pal system protein YbgF
MLVLTRASATAAVVATILSFAAPALAQDGGRSPNFLDNLFGGNSARQQAPATAGPDEADLAVQIDQLQQQVRQLTGTIEQLQYRNRQLEEQVRALGGTAPAPTAAPGTPAPQAIPQRGAMAPATNAYPPSSGNYPSAGNYPSSGGNYPSSSSNYPASSGNYPPAGRAYPSSGSNEYPAPAVIPASPGGRRADVFDPNANPNAPGAPRPLGSADSASHPPIGASDGRMAGAPLDLSTPGRGGDQTLASADGSLPAPPPRNPNATGAQMASVAPPSATPRDEFDLAYGYVKRRDYALAENSLRDFLKKYPSDGHAADAQYWLGESLYQRQRYRDAAESFLTVTTKFDRSHKAPEALLRLGQSLAALGEKETACAAWGEIERKYSRASADVKKSVAAEQKRVRC